MHITRSHGNLDSNKSGSSIAAPGREVENEQPSELEIPILESDASQEVVTPEEDVSLPEADNLEDFDISKVTNRIVTSIAVKLQEIQNHHGIARVAMDSTVQVFEEAMRESNVFFQSWLQKHIPEDTLGNAKDMDPLSRILCQSRLSTWSKRQTICQREMNYVTEREIPIGHDSLGDMRSIAYSSPRQLLCRFLTDTTVKHSFEEHQRSLQEGQKTGYNDFFNSSYYFQLQLTLTPEERLQCPDPIVVVMYRYKY